MSIVKNTILLSIKIYQRYMSPLFPGKCRFYPTCSEYCYMAFDKYGVLKGLIISLNRVRKCHPFNSGGYDPLI